MTRPEIHVVCQGGRTQHERLRYTREVVITSFDSIHSNGHTAASCVSKKRRILCGVYGMSLVFIEADGIGSRFPPFLHLLRQMFPETVVLEALELFFRDTAIHKVRTCPRNKEIQTTSFDRLSLPCTRMDNAMLCIRYDIPSTNEARLEKNRTHCLYQCTVQVSSPMKRPFEQRA